MYDLCGSGLCLMNGKLGCFLDACTIQCRNLYCLAAEVLLDLIETDLIAILLYNVHHVDRHHDWDSKLLQLCGEVEVTLEVRTIHDVQNRIRLCIDEIVSCNNLLQCVWRKGINTREIGNGHVAVSLQLAFLLLYGYAWPVTNILIGSGQLIKQCRFSTVWITCECNCNCHWLFSSSKILDLRPSSRPEPSLHRPYELKAHSHVR